MSHVLTDIRKSAVNILLGNTASVPVNPGPWPTDAGKNVFPNRPTPLWEPELPAICAWTSDEEENPGRGQEFPTFYDRTLDFVVEIIVSAEFGYDDELDNLTQQVEDLLLNKWFLKDPVTGVETCNRLEMSNQKTRFVGENVENIVASRLITFKILYSTDVVVDSTTVPLKRIRVDYNTDVTTGDGHLGPEASDLIHLENDASSASASQSSSSIGSGQH